MDINISNKPPIKLSIKRKTENNITSINTTTTHNNPQDFPLTLYNDIEKLYPKKYDQSSYNNIEPIKFRTPAQLSPEDIEIINSRKYIKDPNDNRHTRYQVKLERFNKIAHLVTLFDRIMQTIIASYPSISDEITNDNVICDSISQIIGVLKVRYPRALNSEIMSFRVQDNIS